jgi:hypothetical protein
VNLADAAILTASLGVSGWCVWHCVRGIRAMRRGQSASCCPPATDTTTAQLADLRRELAALQHLPPGGEDHAVTTPR